MPVRHARGCEVVYDIIVATRRVGGGISQQSQRIRSRSVNQGNQSSLSIYLSLSLHFLVCLFQILFFFRDLQVTQRGRGRGEVGRGKLVLLIDWDFCGKRGIETT